MKQCNRCKEAKPLSEFFKKNPITGRLSTFCKKCDYESKKKYNELWRQNNYAHLREQQLSYFKRQYHQSKNSVVYIIKGVELYKIGHSNNFTWRWSHYMTHMEIDPQLIHLIETPDRIKLEKQLHAIYKEKRIRGEWFALTDADVAYLRTL